MQEITFKNCIQNKTPIKTKKTIFNTDPINKLNDAEKNKIEGKLNEHECYTALQDMKNNKSPGSDGLSVEVECCWNDLKIHLISSINYSFEISNLTELQRQGIITLLPKHGKDLKILATGDRSVY